MELPPHTHKRSVQFKRNGFKVVLHVLAYREVDDDFLYSCVSDWIRSQGKKKLKTNMEVTFPTLYGV